MQTFTLTVNLTQQDYEALYPELKVHPVFGDPAQRWSLLGMFLLLILLIVGLIMIGNVPFADRSKVMSGLYAATGALVVVLGLFLRRAYLIRKRRTAIRDFLKGHTLGSGTELDFGEYHLRVRSGEKRFTYIWSGLTQAVVDDSYVALHDQNGIIFLLPRGNISGDDWERIHDYLLHIRKMLEAARSPVEGV